MRFDDLLDDTRPGLSQAPDAVILAALRRAAMKFFRDSMAWMDRVDDMQTQAGVSVYDLEPPSDSRIERLLWVKYNGVQLSGQARERDLGAMSSTDAAPRWWALVGDKIEVWPTPKEQGTLSAYAALVPTRTARSIPDSIGEDYRDGIIALARADMMGNKPGMPYHSPQEASIQYKFGLEAIARAKRKQVSGNWTQMRVQPRPLA